MSEETKTTGRRKRIEKPKEEKEKTLSPKEYFEYVKSKKNTMTEEELINTYENALQMIKRYEITGQTKPIKKLMFLLECIEAEYKVVKAGYKHFVYRWDLEEYIENISDKSVKLIEMKNYEREFPDEVLDDIIKAKEVFGDELYVVFTDYTGKEQRKVAKERREKDPILFGALTKDDAVLDRLYYVCDWVDQTCDLTLEQLAKNYHKYHKKDGKELVKTLEHPKDLIELRKLYGLYEENSKASSGYIFTNEQGISISSNTRTVTTSVSRS